MAIILLGEHRNLLATLRLHDSTVTANIVADDNVNKFSDNSSNS